MKEAALEAGAPKRIICMDQLRGYAIFGMLLVNAKGLFFEPVLATLEGSGFHAIYESILHQLSHHRTEFTYADTIAPLFVFIVGMGMRLSWLKRSEKMEPGAIRKSMAKRYAILVLIAFAIYAGWLWDALMDIGLAGLLALFLIDKKPGIRVAAAFLFVLAYQCIHSFTSYGIWSMHGRFSLENEDYVPLLVQLVPLHGELFDVTLNGGPLGPLSWVMMLLLGSFAYDVMAGGNEKKFYATCVGWGLGLCALGYALTLEWPGVKEAWPFSARYMTAPFPLWASGLCFFHLLLFYVVNDKLNIRIPTFTSVGMNPLIIYIVQILFLDVAGAFVPESFSLPVGILGFAVFWGAFAGAAYYMHKRRIYVKL